MIVESYLGEVLWGSTVKAHGFLEELASAIHADIKIGVTPVPETDDFKLTVSLEGKCASLVVTHKDLVDCNSRTIAKGEQQRLIDRIKGKLI